jgi:hypothetical protein
MIQIIFHNCNTPAIGGGGGLHQPLEGGEAGAEGGEEGVGGQQAERSQALAPGARRPSRIEVALSSVLKYSVYSYYLFNDKLRLHFMYVQILYVYVGWIDVIGISGEIGIRTALIGEAHERTECPTTHALP